MHFPNEPTLYLDVTQMLGNRRQTGIQRVVRALARVGPAVAAQFHRNCRLVHAVGSQFYRLRFEHIDHQRRAWLFRLAERRLGRRLLRAAWPWATKPVRPEPGDVLVTLNATWDAPAWFEAVAEFRRTGFVASVMYDLTPQSHPQFHTADLCERFRRWLESMEQHSDHWIGISRHVARALTCHLSTTAGRGLAQRQPTVSAFKLGSELDRGTESRQWFEPRAAGTPRPTDIRPSLATFLAAPAPTVLMVGTLEPRKNHLATLLACDELWQRGWAGQLLLIGRPGWQHERVLEAIAAAPRERLLWLEDASDEELRVAYQRSELLAFPSWEEGFGLPIVEALSYGTPVLASDHPVHREVGGEACRYFPADSPAELARLIQKATDDRFRQLRSLVANFRVVTWEQSCRQLLADAILANSRRTSEQRSPVGSLFATAGVTAEPTKSYATLSAKVATRAA